MDYENEYEKAFNDIRCDGSIFFRIMRESGSAGA